MTDQLTPPRPARSRSARARSAGHRADFPPAGAPRRVVFESETTLRAPEGFQLPDLSEVRPDVTADVPADAELETTYHDSADLALASTGISLRYRVGEPGPPWTLKLPTGPSAPVIRRELAFDGPPDTVPAAARDLLHVALRSRVLLPVARLVSLRSTVTLSSRGGVPLAAVVHDRVTAYRGDTEITRFGEVQVQAVDLDRAGRALHEDLVRLLVRAGCTVAPTAPKLLRTYGVLSPIGLPAAPREGAAGSLRDVVVTALASGLARLAEHDAGVRADDDIEDVHQLRVAARRLRSDLRTFRFLLDPPWQQQLRGELGWLGTLAGPVRDADVLLARLDAQVAALPEPDCLLGRELTHRLEDQRARDRDALLAGMRGARYDLLLDSLADAVVRPRLSPAGRRRAGRRGPRVLARALDAQWRAVTAEVAALGPDPDVAGLHRVRIRAKRCRYAAEAVVPVLGRPASRLARAATDVQTLLGDLHDAVVAQDWLRDAVQFAPAAACAGGQLIAAERAEVERLRAAWPELWRDVEPRAGKALAALTRTAS